MKEVHLIYFSPALSTRKITRSISKAINKSVKEYDITQGLPQSLTFNEDDLVIFGIPVYSGRVPALASQYLQKIKGLSTPAILVSVYGNREYEDALLELKNITKSFWKRKELKTMRMKGLPTLLKDVLQHTRHTK